MPHLDAVTAIPGGRNIVQLYMDAGGEHYRAMVNGRVIHGKDVLDAVHANTETKGEFVRDEADIPGRTDSIKEMSAFCRSAYGIPIDGRDADAYMCRADDGVNKGVRPLK